MHSFGLDEIGGGVSVGSVDNLLEFIQKRRPTNDGFFFFGASLERGIGGRLAYKTRVAFYFKVAQTNAQAFV